MVTSSNGNIFRVTGPLCGEFTGPGEFPAQRPVTRSFDVFFDLRLNKRLSKQPWGWWFETPAWPLWRHRNVLNALTLSRKQTPIELWIIVHNYTQTKNVYAVYFQQVSMCRMGWANTLSQNCTEKCISIHILLQCVPKSAIVNTCGNWRARMLHETTWGPTQLLPFCIFKCIII